MIEISKENLKFLLEYAHCGTVENPGTTMEDYKKMDILIEKYKDICGAIGL